MRTVRSSWFWIIVLAVAILAGFSQRLTVNATSPAVNVWDVLVPVQADLYLLAYLFVPVWILRLSLELANRADETWLQRYGSRLRWLMGTGRWAAGQAGALLLVWLAACLILTAGLPWATGWSHTAGLDGRDLLLEALQDRELGPVLAWGLQWVAYLGLLLTIFAVLALAALLTHRPWQLYLSATIVYLIMVIGLRGGLPVGHLMFVYQAVAAGRPAWLPILAPVVVIGVILAGYAAIQKTTRSSRRISVERLGPTSAYLATVVAGIIAAAVNLGEELNLPDLLLSAFYGFDDSQLNLGVYSYFLLTFAGFSLLHLVSAEQRLWSLYLLVSIRSGSPRRWMLYAWRDIAIKAVGLMLTLTTLSVVIVVVTRQPLSGPAAGLVIYQFTVNGTLQLITATGLTLLIAYLTRNRGAVLATIGVLVIIQTPAINSGQVLPVGLNALGLAADWPTVLGFTRYLGIAGLALVGLSLAVCSRRIRPVLERTAA